MSKIPQYTIYLFNDPEVLKSADKNDVYINRIDGGVWIYNYNHKKHIRISKTDENRFKKALSEQDIKTLDETGSVLLKKEYTTLFELNLPVVIISFALGWLFATIFL